MAERSKRATSATGARFATSTATCAASRASAASLFADRRSLFDSRLALMSGLFVDHHGKFREYAHQVWELFFRRELDIEKFEQLAPLIKKVGLVSRRLPTLSPRPRALAIWPRR